MLKNVKLFSSTIDFSDLPFRFNIFWVSIYIYLMISVIIQYFVLSDEHETVKHLVKLCG